MFGRSKAQETSTPPVAAPQVGGAVKTEGKGRATPKRREAELRNRKPIVGAPRTSDGTKEERQAARKAQQAAAREERLRSREALANGDERHLPAQHKGPAKRFVRDYVDARWNLAELFLPVAFLAILVSLLNIRAAQLGSMALLYGTAIFVGVDCWLLSRRVNKLASERFGSKEAAGAGRYAVMRAIQIRRARLPRPQVKHGDKV